MSNWRVDRFTEFCPAEFVPAMNLETSAGHHCEELFSVLAVVSVQLVGVLPPGQQNLRLALKGTPLDADGETGAGLHDDVARRELGEGRVGAEHQVPPGHQVQGRQPGGRRVQQQGEIQGRLSSVVSKQFLVDQVWQRFSFSRRSFPHQFSAKSYGTTANFLRRDICILYCK